MLLQTVKADLEVKRPTMDKLCSISQDLLSSVKNKEVASKLEARLDNLAQRWDKLIHGLETSSSQVRRRYPVVFSHILPGCIKCFVRGTEDINELTG